MKIIELNPIPVETVPYLNSKPGSRAPVAGMRGVERTFLPIFQGVVSGLPDGLEGLVIASDLQGKVKNPKTRALKLLGEVLPETLRLVVEVELGLDPLKFGVILAGDMFALLEKRGGLGDVIPVWEAFRGEFRWVAGVAGNHDQFGNTPDEEEAFRAHPRMHVLHGNVARPDGFSVGGVCGIIGRKGKPMRFPLDEYLERLSEVQRKNPDLIVVHQSPAVPEMKAVGDEDIRDFLDMGAPTLVVAGHTHWKEPLAELPNGTQVLNSDARAFVLRGE